MNIKVKKFYVSMVLLISLLVQFSVPAKLILAADDLGFQFLTNVSLTDKEGNPFVGSIQPDSKLMVNYTYAIPDEIKLDPFRTYAITKIPDEIEVLEAMTIPLKTNRDGLDVIVANVYVSLDHQVSIQFTELINDEDYLYDRSGNFFVYSEFDEGKVQKDEDIIFDLGSGHSVPIRVNFDIVEDSFNVKLAKSGSYDSLNNVITWKLEVRPESAPRVKPIQNVIIKDLIQAGQTYVPDSATISPAVASGAFDFSVDNGLTYQFNQTINNTAGELYTITFKTKPDLSAFDSEEKTIQFSNQASGTFNTDGTTLSNTAVVTTKVDFISKQGTYNSSTKKINWTIKINMNNLDLINPSIEDILPAGLTLVENSVKINGNNVTLGPLGPLTYDTVTRKLKYSFIESINKTQTMTFTTDVTDPNVFLKNVSTTFTNEAVLVGTGIPANATSKVGVGVSSSIINKVNEGFDTKTHELKWKIIINENNVLIKGASISDVILPGQEYVPGSFMVNGIPVLTGLIYTPALPGDTLKTGEITYTFPGDVTAKSTITFRTRVTDPNVYANNVSVKFRNTAFLSGSNIVTSSDYEDITYVSNVITKSSGGYDYNSRELTWKVKVNSNGMLMKNAYFLDEIGPEQEFIEGSVKIGNVLMNKAENPSDKDAYYYDEASRILRVNFSEEINIVSEVTFKTKIVDLSIFNDNKSKDIKNSATLFGEDIPEVKSSTLQTIGSSVVNKTGSYANGTNFIDWAVTINKNQLSLSNPILEDVLQTGLTLDISSVKLFELSIDKNNIETLGQEIPLSMENINFDKSTRMFTFKFNQPITKAYRLTFSTDIDDAYKSATFSNTINLKGTETKESSTSGSFNVSFQTGGGSASGTSRGSLTLIKVDEKDSSKFLAGTEFELLDKYGNVVSQKTTDASGKIVFSKLILETSYTIREKTPVEGYLLSDEVYSFILHNTTTEKNLTYEFKNTQITGDIEVTKTNVDGEFIKATSFTLYKVKDAILGDAIQTQSTDASGKLLFKDIPYGDYRIIETTAAEGYTLGTAAVDISIRTEGKIETASFTNEKIKGNLVITKTDEKEKPLPGAEFELYSDKSYEDGLRIPLSKGVTDENGILRFNDIVYGTYQLAETKSPEGYLLNSDARTITIKEDGITLEESYINLRIRGSIEITKLSDEGAKLQGAEFSLFKVMADETLSFVEVKTTDDEGLAKFENLEYGNYAVKETKSPVGYNLNQETKMFEIREQGKILTASLTNIMIRGNLKVTKTSIEGNLLEGAEFTLYGKADEKLLHPLAVETTNNEGFAIFEKVTYGDYWLVETKAPEGYLLDGSIKEINVREEAVTLEESFTNERILGNIEILKNSEDETKLKDTEFTLYQIFEQEKLVKVESKITDENGRILFENLPYGSYRVIETKAAEGYTLGEAATDVKITDHGKTITYTFTNQKIRGNIKIAKTSTKGDPLANAEFALYEKSDEKLASPIKTLKTDVEGSLIFSNLLFGQYQVVETKAPEGYLISDTVLEFNIAEDGVTLTGTFTNERITGNIIITKRNIENQLLAGAEFTLYKSEDVAFANPLMALTTNETGIAFFEDIPYGEYVILETKSPEGYSLSNRKLEIKLDVHDETIEADWINEKTPVAEIVDPLPKAGSQGTATVYGIGLLMIALGVLLTKKKIRN